MHAQGSSPPPQDLDFLLAKATAIPTTGPAPALTPSNSGNGTRSSSTAPQVQSRKRKRAQGASATHAAASPAPSDPGSATGNGSNSTDLLASRTDLSSRPILSISRGPIFIPVSEGSEWYKTDLIGVNRVGFRYIPAGINPPGFASPCRTIESNPTSFRISWEDRSPLIKVSKDGLSLAGFKGFRGARCNAPMREGKWYLEVKILHGEGEHVGDLDTTAGSISKGEGSHVRLGWGRREASLNAPVGLDGYSYGYRDKTGEKVTLSRPRPYGKPFASGDVVGMYISLPLRREANKKDPHDPAHIKRERIPIDLKGQEVFEILEYPQSKEMSSLMDYSGKVTSSASVPSSSNKKAANSGKLPDRSGPTNTTKVATPILRSLPILPSSRIAFFINGECQGTAFQDLYDYLPLRQTDTQRKAKDKKRTREGVKEHRENPFDDGTLGYYPFISLFNDAVVQINPGPDFEHPPPPDIDALLDGKPQPEALSAGTSQSTTTTTGGMEVDTNSKQEPSTGSSTQSLQLSPQSHLARTWLPAIDRYPQFMAEQWALDALEELEAQGEFAKQAAMDKLEEEKRIQRNKKRQLADAKRREKKKQQMMAAESQQHSLGLGYPGQQTQSQGRKTSSRAPSLALDNPHIANHPHYGATSSAVHSNRPSPSPLRHSTAYSSNDTYSSYPTPTYASPSYANTPRETGANAFATAPILGGSANGSVYNEHSPAPTIASYGDAIGGQSGYNSESNGMDGEHEAEGEVELEVEAATTDGGDIEMGEEGEEEEGGHIAVERDDFRMTPTWPLDI